MIIYHVLDTRAILYQLRKSITPPSSEYFFAFFCLIASIHRLFTHLEAEARSCITQRAIFLWRFSIFSRSAAGSGAHSFSLSLVFCVCVRVCMLRVSTQRYATGPTQLCFPKRVTFLVMPREPSNATLLAHRDLPPRIHISPGNAS